MGDCVFCQMLVDEAPGNIVYSSEKCFGLIPLDQISKGHTILVSRDHFENILDADVETLKDMSTSFQRLSRGCHHDEESAVRQDAQQY